MRVNRGTLFVFFLLLVLVFISGCATIVPYKENMSLVFGYIDMTDAPTALEWVTIEQLSPPTDTPYAYCGVDDGYFFHSRLEPGAYKLIKFGGMKRLLIFGGGRYEYTFPAQGKGEWDPIIESPGIVFLGSYKYVTTKQELFVPGQFDLVKIKNPTEKEALAKILVLLEKSGLDSQMSIRVKNRLKEL